MGNNQTPIRRDLEGKYVFFRYKGRPRKTCTGSYCNYCNRDTYDLVRYKCYIKETGNEYTYGNDSDLLIYSNIGICNICMRMAIKNIFLPTLDRCYRDSIKSLETVFGGLGKDILSHILSFM